MSQEIELIPLTTMAARHREMTGEAVRYSQIFRMYADGLFPAERRGHALFVDPVAASPAISARFRELNRRVPAREAAA